MFLGLAAAPSAGQEVAPPPPASISSLPALPARVVSMNLCTDQLAMLLAAPGQLLSVSWIASDPLSSSMAEEAAAWPANRGQAEQIFLMQPDLVLAGEWSSFTTVSLLERLGVKVRRISTVNGLSDVVTVIRETAAAMGREAAGEALVAEYEAGLAELGAAMPEIPAALWHPNGYTTGAGTLADDMLHASGFSNIGADAGLAGGGVLALERLVMAAPDAIITSAPYPGASRAEELLNHPALAELRSAAGVLPTTSADWVCGTPHVLRALSGLHDLRRELGDKP